MLRREGLTLIEIVVVLVIVGVVIAFCLPNFSSPNEQALAANAQNNLLAIYTAEKNYNNNNGFYCTTNTPAPEPSCAETGTTTCAPDLASINCNLSLNIQDDGSYTYLCTGTTCKATRTTTTSSGITVALTSPIVLTGSTPNPSCSLAANLCP